MKTILIVIGAIWFILFIAVFVIGAIAHYREDEDEDK